MSLKLDAICSRNSKNPLNVLTEGPLGPAWKGQAGDECRGCNSGNTGPILTSEHTWGWSILCPGHGDCCSCVCSLSAGALTWLPGFWESWVSDQGPSFLVRKGDCGVNKSFQAVLAYGALAGTHLFYWLLECGASARTTHWNRHRNKSFKYELMYPPV